MEGRLNLIIGPMFSGKSTMLLTRYRRYRIAGKRCLLVKYAGDKRYDQSEDSIVTHDQLRYKAVSCRKLADIQHLLSQYDVVCIDEIQFYPDAVRYADAWATAGKIVEVCGLSGDFKREAFEQISQIIPKADSIQHVTAVCRITGKEAPFSQRISTETEQEVIGGTDKYRAASRQAYFAQEQLKSKS